SATFEVSPHGANTWTTIGTDSSAAGGWNVSWDTTGGSYPDGRYDLRVTLRDVAGNVSAPSTPTTVTVDNTAPSGTVTSPIAAADVRGASVTLASADAADGSGSGVASTAFQVSPHGANTWTTVGTDSSAAGGWHVSWDTTGGSYPDGQYDARGVVTDATGDTAAASAPTTFTVDNTPRGSATRDPLAAAIANGVTLSGSATDATSGVVSLTYLYCSGAACTPSTAIGSSATGPGYDVTWSTMPADGTYRVIARATDAAGNTTDSAPQTVVVDNTAPVTTLDALPAAVKNGQSLTGTSADGAGSGVNNVQYLYCAGAGCTPSTAIGSSTSGPTWPVTWNGMPADGTYRVLAVGTDNAGNAGPSAIQTVVVDNTPPSSATIGPSSTGPGYDVTWNGQPADGSYIVVARVYDAAGNYTDSAPQTVTIDNTPPTATLDPLPSAVANSFELTGSASDAGSGVASLEYLYCSGAGCTPSTSIGSSTSSPGYDVTWNGQPADGTYRVIARATDDAGNKSDSAAQTVV